MHPLKGDSLVKAWERGANQDALGHALVMLACACPERPMDEIAALNIPERDMELLRLHHLTFGDSLCGCMSCPSCMERLEFEVSVSAVLDRLALAKPGKSVTWQNEHFVFTLRPVNSRDLAAAIREPQAARRILLERCTSVHASNAEEREPKPSIEDFEQLALEKFDELHQGTEILLRLSCPACKRIGQIDLDIAQFLWLKVQHAAMTLLREINELAKAYGWAETAIMEMSGTRRSVYLEMSRP